jgi:hypothetical protein
VHADYGRRTVFRSLGSRLALTAALAVAAAMAVPASAQVPLLTPRVVDVA